MCTESCSSPVPQFNSETLGTLQWNVLDKNLALPVSFGVSIPCFWLSIESRCGVDAAVLRAMDGQPGKSRRTSISGINEAGPTGPPNLRRASATAAMPATRHVGFHVEGVPPSPAQAILASAHCSTSTAAGSPTPVIIPPSFQVRAAVVGIMNFRDPCMHQHQLQLCECTFTNAIERL